MDEIDKALVDYLKGPPPHRLEIGAGPNGKPGWLATDLLAGVGRNGTRIVALNATERFPIPADCFDFIFIEHMIEHIGFDDGLNMLSECHRILKPDGVLRVVTPSLGFLLKVLSPDRGMLEERYREWSVTTCEVYPPAVTNAFFLNNFVRNWGHNFIYDHETLRLALTLAGFREVVICDLNASVHEPLHDLEAEHRLPPGFLKLESMVFEAVKGPAEDRPALPGRNLALGRRATQSSVSPWSRAPTPDADAAGVVSGVWTNSYNCHTAIEDRPWWRVDLESVCRIQQVRLYNRLTNFGMMVRSNRFEIDVSNDDATWRTVFRKDNDMLVGGRRQTPFIWTPEREIRGRFLRIQLLGRTYLHLEQVEIFGMDEATASG
jgi:predicted SAM-dependent methyltransferase